MKPAVLLPSERWGKLQRRKQLRVIKAMRLATARTWSLENIHIERMISGALEELDAIARRAPTTGSET